MAELMIDLVLALLLAGVIVSAFILNRRMEAVRAGQAELNALVEQLNRAATNARAAVGELKNAGIGDLEELNAAVAKARAMKDELVLITEAADSLASRIEQKITAESRRVRTADAPAAGFMDDPLAATQGIRDALRQAR